MSDSLPSIRSRPFFVKSNGSDSLFFQEQIAISRFRSQKTSNSLEKPKSEFPTLVQTQAYSVKKERDSDIWYNLCIVQYSIQYVQ